MCRKGHILIVRLTSMNLIDRMIGSLTRGALWILQNLSTLDFNVRCQTKTPLCYKDVKRSN